MPTTVYSIRIPQKIRKMMEEMKEINWQEEIRRVVEELVRNKRREKLLAEAKEIRKEMKISVSSAELIREDRDAR